MHQLINKGFKSRLINDPIYGFVAISNSILADLIEHPYFQRLRRINQLGLTYYVYPGAMHSRFQHTLGALHLLNEALRVLKNKGIKISKSEEVAAGISILMHDMGHGPFSHTLEKILIQNIDHEYLSHRFMLYFNDELKGKLDLALAIFNNQYERKFFHQLISGQLDVDRLDYLMRDSFFTGVHEGIISSERIINLMNVHKNQLVIEDKGIYSVEKFLMARRLMYWQVYLHKAVLSAEFLLIHILKRAKELSGWGHHLPASEALTFFLTQSLTPEKFESLSNGMYQFAQLDDYDIFSAVKVWASYDDKVLCYLCRMLLNRDLLKAEVSENKINADLLNRMQIQFAKSVGISKEEAEYFVFSEEIFNHPYNLSNGKITFLFKDHTTKDINETSEYINSQLLNQTAQKNFLFYPKNFTFLS